MTLHLPTLLLASVAVMAASAALLTLFGLTQRVYRGFWWWTGAQWLSTAGLALQLLRQSHPAVLPLSNLLLLQAPVLMLFGIRRFYPRHELRVPVLADVLLLAVAYQGEQQRVRHRFGINFRLANVGVFEENLCRSR